MSSAFRRRASARTRAKNSRLTGRMPPSPWMGSTRMGRTVEANWRARGGAACGGEAPRGRAGGGRRKGRALLFPPRRPQRRKRPPVERILERENPPARLVAVGAVQARVGARELQGALDGLGAAVGGKDAVEPGGLPEPTR